MLDEKELIERCRKGSRAAQRALYDLFSKKMMVVCLRYARSTVEAEDMLQEGFVRVFQSLDGFRQDAKLETWMTRIMVNIALTHHRKKLYLFPMVDIEKIDHQEAPEGLARLHFTELIAMIQSLPQGCQIVFNLFAIEGYSHKEISDMLGISVGTSKSQYARARVILQEKLKAESKQYKAYGEGRI
ncbi:MAG: sigma-70 family RNA polymerase sigma factor [Cyclobacteriaceae bacterium]|nr:sigma-70 family RNA polymerase sigma factor [Cyclobacteriaceae bacterium]